MGSLNGQTRTNMWQEKFKLKGWLSSHLFQEQFPSHYAEIIHYLPLQEYMNPMSGLLNLAAKLPPEIPKPDLGPCVYISYGYAEELVQADSMAKLCYDSYDVVCLILSPILHCGQLYKLSLEVWIYAFFFLLSKPLYLLN